MRRGTGAQIGCGAEGKGAGDGEAELAGEDGGGGALFRGWCGTFRRVCRILKQRNM